MYGVFKLEFPNRKQAGFRAAEHPAQLLFDSTAWAAKHGNLQDSVSPAPSAWPGMTVTSAAAILPL